jgi:hypothetical protein
MEIRTLWAPSEADDEMPWLVDAVDEYAIDSNGGLPDDYQEAMTKNPQYRELIILIPEQVVTKLFQAPLVNGAIKKNKEG